MIKITEAQQKGWYDFYKENPRGWTYDEISTHVANNKDVSPFVRCLILEVADVLRDCKDDRLKKYATLRYDIALERYFGYNDSILEDTTQVLKSLASRFDTIISSNDEECQKNFLADIVICVYGLAYSLGIDLDAAISDKMNSQTKS